MLMRLVQMLICIAVAWANIYFETGVSGPAVAMQAFAAAWLLTVLPLHVVDWLHASVRRPH